MSTEHVEAAAAEQLISRGKLFTVLIIINIKWGKRENAENGKEMGKSVENALTKNFSSKLTRDRVRERELWKL